MEPPTIGPCGLYVHVPFCTAKCGYCDFYSVPHAGRDTGGLVERLRTELGVRLDEAAAPVSTKSLSRPKSCRLAWETAASFA